MFIIHFGSTVEVACGLPEFLCAAAGPAELGTVLSGGEWTVFAPTDTAFGELGATLDAVVANVTLLTDILLFHAVEEVIFADDLECSSRTTMANGKETQHRCLTTGEVFQTGPSNPIDDMPRIISADIGACNGIIHVVDEVLLP